MKITLKRTNEQIELIKAMASRNRDVAYEAQVALAEFIGPVINEVINQAPTFSNLFTNMQYNADDNPSIPLDLYYDVTDEDYINVYTTSVPGGLPSNHVHPTHSELKFATYRLDSAVTFDRRYASRSRLDVVSKTFTRVAQEVLQKQERTSSNIVLSALMNGSTTADGTTYKHIFSNAKGGTAIGGFQISDLNNLLLRGKRIRPGWVGGTPVGQGQGVTDLVVSPETMRDIRAMAYNPVGEKDADGSKASSGDGPVIAAPEGVRAQMWGSAGVPEFYGVSLMEIHELGPSKKWTTLAATFETDPDTHPETGSDFTFAAADDLAIGIDRSREALIRAVAVDSESGGEFVLAADDQFSVRQGKIGYYGSLEEGRVVLDDRVLVGVCIDR